jgi:hypothetical protein
VCLAGRTRRATAGRRRLPPRTGVLVRRGRPPRSLGRLTGTVDGESIELEAEEDAWAREVRSFVETVDGGEGDLRSPYGDARKTFELTLAVNEALDEENAVELPLVSQ